MDNGSKIVLVKFVHTAVWVVMAAASAFILYSGIVGTLGPLLWICVALLVFESLVLLVNKWTCPLTPIAMRYTAERSDNFDIYLPRLVAKHNKIIFGGIFAAGLMLVVFNVLIGR